MELLEELDSILTEYIHPTTYPVAVKFSAEPVLPPKAKRPTVAFGHRLNLCQGIALARRNGWTMGFLKEDHGCGNSQVIMGICEEPDFIKDGSICYPLYTKDLETGVKTQRATPQLPMGRAAAILMAPLHKTDFVPDVILVYCTPGQAVRLIQGALYNVGGTIDSKFMGRAACGAELVVPMMTGECNVIVPGGGEKVFAMPEDGEMVFAMPVSKMQDVIDGLKGTHKAGAARFPAPYFGLRAEPTFPDIYHPLDKYTGILK